MTLIGYLTRTHFAEAAIEDALPEEVGPLARALALVDDEPASMAVCTRVQEALGQTTISLARVGRAGRRVRGRRVADLDDPGRRGRGGHGRERGRGEHGEDSLMGQAHPGIQHDELAWVAGPSQSLATLTAFGPLSPCSSS